MSVCFLEIESSVNKPMKINGDVYDNHVYCERGITVSVWLDKTMKRKKEVFVPHSRLVSFTIKDL